tara:strand:+ start:4510 stop:5544 length:1035 start_codon:yes stop_codon:yes gene_type:complete
VKNIHYLIYIFFTFIPVPGLIAQEQPEREITNVKGDLYRFREVRHIGMFLVTPEGIILVDPTNSKVSSWLKEQLDKRFNLPVKYVIYSHSHNDHSSGGEVFQDTAIFVGHINMLKNLKKPKINDPLLPREVLWDINKDNLIQKNESIGHNYIEDYFDLYDKDKNGGLDRSEIWEIRFGGNQIPPQIVYSDKATISLGGKTVELIYTGKNHTDDMTVVYFPDEKTIYTVDFLTPKRLPRTDLDGGFLPDWVDSLKKVELIDFNIISPGHEAPGTKQDVTEQRKYLEELVEKVSLQILQGKTEEEILRAIDMSHYNHLMEYDLSILGNISGVYEMLISNIMVNQRR